MKKALTLVLTMCIVLSLFATFVVSASAEDAVNLAAGKTYTYTPTDSHYYHSNEDWACSKTATTALTDGVVGGEYYGAASMVGWKNCDPAVTIDLGKVSTVSELKYNVFAGMDGIVEPTSVKVEVSVDGNTWTEVTCTSAAGTPVSSSLSWVTGYAVDITLTPEAAVDAQYVKLSFTRTGTFVFLSEIEVWGTEKKVEVEWKPFFLSHFDDFSAEGACVIFTEAYEGCAWWLHVAFAPIAGEENAYEVVQVLDGRGDGKAAPIAIPEGGFVYAMNTGNNWGDLVEECTANGTLESQWWYAQYQADPTYYTTNFINDATNAMLADASTWQVGDKLMFKNVDLEGKTVPTSTSDVKWYDSSYVCTAQYAAYVPGYSEDEGGEVVITKGENIALNKTYTISGCGERDTYYANLTDGKAVDHVCSGLKEGDEGFFNNHEEWFGFYCNGDDQTIINAPDKVGTATIDLTEATDIYSVRVNVFNGDMWGIVAPAAVKVSFSDDNVTYSEEISVAVTKSSEENSAVWIEFELPEVVNAQYVKVVVDLNGTFAFINEIEVYEAVKTVAGEEPEEEADTSLMGDAPERSAFTATVTGPEAWKAGDKVTVDVTIEVTADQIALYQVMFNLFYDAADVEFVAPEGEGTVNVTTGADSWKGEDSMLAASVDGAYGKLEVGLASVEEDDVLVKGDKLVVSFEFTVKEDAEGLINFQLSNEELVGYTYDDPATPIAGTGSNLAIAPAGDDLGDAGIYAIAALAIVALIGTAVVIKRRA